MKLVTFGIDGNRNLIIQFPVFVQPYTYKPLILHQLETAPVPSQTKINKQILTLTCRLIDPIVLLTLKHIFVKTTRTKNMQKDGL